MTTLQDQVVRYMDAATRMVAPDFCIYEGTILVQVRCKRCGNYIQIFKAYGIPLSVLGPTGQQIQPYSLSRTSLYTEVRILCTDGSKHDSGVCTECLPKLTLQDLEDFLTCDTQVAIKEANILGTSIPETLLDLMLLRRAVERIV